MNLAQKAKELMIANYLGGWNYIDQYDDFQCKHKYHLGYDSRETYILKFEDSSALLVDGQDLSVFMEIE